MKKKLSVLSVMILVLALSGCGSGGKYDTEFYQSTSDSWNGGYSEGYYEESMEMSTDGSVQLDTPKVQDNTRKLIKNYDINVETENFDSFIPAVEARVSELGGYVESLNTYFGESYSYRSNRYSNLTIRIPQNKADEFIHFIGNSSNITRQSMDVSDVTLQYVDMASRRDAYITERDRLMELLNDATSLEDILTIEARLSEVRYSLESMESQLRTMDNLVDYSTIRMTIDEVKEYTEPEPETYGQRLVSSAKEGWVSFVIGLEDFSIWFVGALPSLVLWAGIIALGVFIVLKIKKRKPRLPRAKKEKKGLKRNTSDNTVLENSEDKNKDAE